MIILTKQEAIEFLPKHVSGTYNPAKYVMAGFVGTKREVLIHLYREAHAAQIAARAEVESDRLARKIEPLNRAIKSGNIPKLFWKTPRDLSVEIPALREFNGAWLVFTNCKLNGGFYKNVPGVTAKPETVRFDYALREIQRRVLP